MSGLRGWAWVAVAVVLAALLAALLAGGWLAPWTLGPGTGQAAGEGAGGSAEDKSSALVVAGMRVGEGAAALAGVSEGAGDGGRPAEGARSEGERGPKAVTATTPAAGGASPAASPEVLPERSPAGDLVVRIVDPSGVPREGVVVSIDGELVDWTPPPPTDAAGRVRFSGTHLVRGPMAVRVRDPRTEAALERVVEVAEAPQEVEITLPDAPPAGTLEVTVRPVAGGARFSGRIEVKPSDQDGRPVPDLSVSDPTSALSPEALAWREEVPPERRAAFRLAPGAYQVALGGLHGARATADALVRSGETTRLELDPPRPGTLIVERHPSCDAETITAQVVVYEAAEDHTLSLPGGATPTTLEATGTIVIRATSPGRRDVHASIELASGETLRHVVDLPRSARLAVRVTAASGVSAPRGVEVYVTAVGGTDRGETGGTTNNGSGDVIDLRESVTPPADTALFEDVPPGPYTVEGASARRSGALAPGEAATVTLESPHTFDALAVGARDPAPSRRREWVSREVLVTVRDEAGRPVAGALVTCRPLAEAPGLFRLSETTTNGATSLALAPGVYALSASSPTRPMGPAHVVTITEEECRAETPPLEVALSIDAPGGGAFVKGAARAPGWGHMALSVLAYDVADGAHLPIPPAPPDAQGRFRAGPLPTGRPVRLVLTLMDPGWRTPAGRPHAPPPGGFAELTLEAGEERTVDLALPEAARIEAVGPDVEALLVRRPGGEYFDGPDEVVSFADERAWTVLPGPIELAVRFRGDHYGLHRARHDVTLAPGEERRIEVAPARGDASLRGVVTLDAPGQRPRGILLEGPGVALLVNDRAPFFAVGLPAGAYRLVIGGRHAATYTLGAGEVKDLGIVTGRP